MIKKPKNQKGFTLIELMLVIALLAISVGVTNDILISLVRSNNKTQVTNEIEQQANFVSLKMEKELRNARNITTPTSGSMSNSMEFELRSGDDIAYRLDTTEGVLYRSENGADEVPVTSNTSPGGVFIECIDGDGTCFSVSGANPQVVNMKMIFNQGQQSGVIGGSFTGSVNLDSTVVIRNTY